jgi:hypothetical protein
MEKDIGKIRKNDTSEIVIRVDDFGGRKGLTSDRYTGFTKAGVRILGADFESFKEMINSVTSEDMAQSEDESSEPKEKQKTFKPKAASKKTEANEELPDY